MQNIRGKKIWTHEITNLVQILNKLMKLISLWCMQLIDNTSVALPFLFVSMIFMWDANVFFLTQVVFPTWFQDYMMFIKLVILNLLYMLFGGVQIFFGIQNLWMSCLLCPISTIRLVAISWIVWGVHFFWNWKSCN